MGTNDRCYALGIDTGGTYTDAVVYDEAEREIVAKAKAPTTHDDLAIGIRGSIETALGASAVDPAAIQMVALSTTLATNALVEGTGRPAALVTVGFEAGALDRGGLRDAIGSDAIIQVAGGHNSHGEPVAELDLDALSSALDEIADVVDEKACND